MHPSPAALITYFDGEAGDSHRRRIARHLTKCQTCSGEIRRIQRERTSMSACMATPVSDNRQSLAVLLSAIAQWRSTSSGAAELGRRLRSQIEWYFGSSALPVVERSGMPAEELLRRTSEMLHVFLGQAAAQAVEDDVLSGLEYTRSEVWR
jgi:anti-sigma factor RsiW